MYACIYTYISSKYLKKRELTPLVVKGQNIGTFLHTISDWFCVTPTTGVSQTAAGTICGSVGNDSLLLNPVVLLILYVTLASDKATHMKCWDDYF